MQYRKSLSALFTVSEKLNVMITYLKIIFLFYIGLQLFQQILLNLDYLAAPDTDEMMMLVVLIVVINLIPASYLIKIMFIYKPYLFKHLHGSIHCGQTYIGALYLDQVIDFFRT